MVSSDADRGVVLDRPIGRALFSLAWPIALSNQLETLTLGLMVFWLGRLLGETGLTVESLFRPVSMMVVWLLTIPSTGSSMLVASSIGAGDGRGFKIARNAIVLALVMWGAVATFAAPFAGPLSSLLAGGLPIERAMFAFLVAWLFAEMPTVAIAESLLDIASSTGWTKLALTRVLINLAVAAALMPVFIDVLGIGIAGAPLASGLAGGTLSITLWLLLRRRDDLGLGSPRGSWRPDFALWREILMIGLPVHVARIAMFAIQAVLIQRVADEGAAAAAGFGVALVIVLFCYMANMALAQASAIVVSTALGAKREDRAASAVRGGITGAMVLSVAFILLSIAGEPIARLFTSREAVVVEAVRALDIMRWGIVGGLLWQVLLALFSAAHKTVRASALLLGAEAIGAVVAFAWPAGSALVGVSVAFCVASTLKAVALLFLAVRVRLPGVRA